MSLREKTAGFFEKRLQPFSRDHPGSRARTLFHLVAILILLWLAAGVVSHGNWSFILVILWRSLPHH